MEIWKKIEGFENYSVSNEGRVKNDKIFLKLSYNKRGYSQVVLWNKNKNKIQTIHRLVAQAFIPNPDNKPEVNHIDYNKTNNHVSNLEWATKKENEDHALQNGLKVKGEQNGGSKLTEIEVIEVRKLFKEGWLKKDLAQKFGITRNSISNIIKRKFWTHI
jgi:hypothetical protein